MQTISNLKNIQVSDSFLHLVIEGNSDFILGSNLNEFFNDIYLNMKFVCNYSDNILDNFKVDRFQNSALLILEIEWSKNETDENECTVHSRK